MILEIKVDLSDIYTDDYTISEVVRKQIEREVFQQVKKDTEKQIQDKITSVVTKMATERLSEVIHDITKKQIEGGVSLGRRAINLPNSRSEYVDDCTIEQFVVSEFMNTSSYGSIRSHIDTLAKNLSVDLKKRYDMLFASQIVNALSEQKLLKDEAIAGLLKKTD